MQAKIISSVFMVLLLFVGFILSISKVTLEGSNWWYWVGVFVYGYTGFAFLVGRTLKWLWK